MLLQQFRFIYMPFMKHCLQFYILLIFFCYKILHQFHIRKSYYSFIVILIVRFEKKIKVNVLENNNFNYLQLLRKIKEKNLIKV